MEIAAGALPWRLMLAATLLLVAISIKSSMASSGMAKPGCQETCGDLTIPYPFGIGLGCYRQGFEVLCMNNTVFMANSSSPVAINYIDLLGGQTRVNTSIATKCSTTTNWASLSPGYRFTISSKANMFTVIGCNARAFQSIQGTGGQAGAWCSTVMCDTVQPASVDSIGQCSGKGCCRTSIAPQLTFSNITFDPPEVEIASVECVYAFIAAQDWFKFDPSYLEDNTFTENYTHGVPTVLDWVAGKELCDEAKKKKKKDASSYACIDKNGDCSDSPNATGYICTCNRGFEGNPYLEEGCKDINECDNQVRYRYCNGTCTNTFGSYDCKLPLSYRVKMFAGISVSAVVLLMCIFALMIQCQRRKLIKEKEKFFQQNGGLLLYEEIRSKQVDTVRIFTTKELDDATDNFDASTELGRGGHGTVYKGVLKDNRVVAIKRSKIMNMLEKDEFVQEMIILSQINHRNVVKLLGCCLEVEVPMLVYECIPNGTLFELIHGRNTRHSIPLDIRLMIAQESAEALAYLHSSASPPIIHGDVKSPNILLGDNYTAKVTDFGASRMLPKDEIQFMTMVQGTLGYLDPEYLQERQLTEKSDVYSFGVVLLELITRKMAIYSDTSGEKKNLASSFLLLMKDNNLHSILDKNILDVNEDMIREVTQLAKHCLSMKGEERPLMTEVARRLQMMRSTWRKELMQNASEQTEYWPENPSHCDPSSSGYNGGLMTLDFETGR